MPKSEMEKMLAGELYRPGDPEIDAASNRARAWMVRYNTAAEAPAAERHALLAEQFGTVGPGCVIRPVFACDYGFNIYLGAKVFLNFNCIVLDVCAVTIGDQTQIGPAVQIYTADHPRDPGLRDAGLEFGRPVRIGRNVWIGGGAIVLPGVSIGDDAIIGAGAIVTRDVEAGTTVAGNPARRIVRSS